MTNKEGMATKKKKLYYANVRILLDTNYAIHAESLAEAIEKTKELKITDCIDIGGDHLESDIQITGVSQDYSSCDLK